MTSKYTHIAIPVELAPLVMNALIGGKHWLNGQASLSKRAYLNRRTRKKMDKTEVERAEQVYIRVKQAFEESVEAFEDLGLVYGGMVRAYAESECARDKLKQAYIKVGVACDKLRQAHIEANYQLEEG